MTQRILITGAGGRIGSMLTPRLTRPGRVLRLLDLAELPGVGVEVIRADLTDPVVMGEACAGVDAVVHLGAIATEAPWADLLRINVDGTRTILEAARAARVPRVILASSIHAAGFYQRPGTEPNDLRGVPVPDSPDGVPAGIPPRPDTYYGVSKAVLESLGSLYADRFGMTVIALRLGACFPEPPDGTLDSWLSPDDCARLIEACLSTDAPGFRIVWGVSRNRRRWLSLAEGAQIGYHPTDDSERFATDRTDDEPVWARVRNLIGRQFCIAPLGENNRRPPR